MNLIYLYIGIICFLIGGLFIYFLLKPKIKQTLIKNEQIEKENADLAILNQSLKEDIEQEQQSLIVLQKKTEIEQNTFNNLKNSSKQAAEDYYKMALEVQQNSFDKEIERISNELEKNRQDAELIYENLLKESVQNYLEQIEEKQAKINFLTKKFDLLQNNVNIAVDASKRKLEIDQKQDFYRICLSNEDIAEIARLREVLPYLRDKTPLNKVIYKVYYEKPLTDMIGRVIGTGTHTGIYKITNIQTQMCYVGQAVDLAARFKQHVKRGVGAEDWTQNKLYPAMYSTGVENFTFEVIEECEREKLNEREDFWQEYFHAKDFGYSIK